MKKFFALIIGCLLLLGGQCIFAQQKIRISIATGGTGGVYYIYGGGLADIINKNIPNVIATAEVTGASVENLRLVARKEATFGFTMNDVLYQAYRGEGRFKEEKLDMLRSVVLIYPHVYHVITLKKYPIYKITDLKGKRVSVGAPGSGTEYKSSLILPLLGVKYEDMKVYRLSFAENTEALKNGTIEVGIWDVAPPASSVMDLVTTHEVRFIPFSEEEIKKVTSTYPFYRKIILKANTYKGQTEDVPSISVWNSIVCHKDTPEDLVYQVTKTIFECKQQLVQVHKMAEFTTPEVSAKESVIPIHPGALKYYKEKGLIK
jgi:TRAP transporter TAXI family solute receptor